MNKKLTSQRSWQYPEKRSLFSKASQMWATWKSKFRNILNPHVVLVNPINYNADNDNGNDIEVKHLEKFRSVWNLIDWMAFFVGLSAFREVDINARMAFTAFVILFTYCSLFYTIFVVWPSIPLLLEVICIFGVLIPGSLKFRWCLKNVKYVFAMNEFFENILVNHPNGRRSDDLAKEMTDAFNKVKIFVAVSVLCFAVFILYPVHAFINEDRLVPIMHVEIPFLDQTNMKDFLIGQSIMVLIGFCGLLGNVAFDLAVLAILFEYRSLVTLLAHDLDDYHEISKKWETCSTAYQDNFLRNICMKYSDIHSYLRCFQRLFATITCLSICSLYASLICSVYATLNNGWISGYAFCLFTFNQMYVQCILGTFVDIHNDRMRNAFCSTPWYTYPVRVQKIFSLLMHASTFNAVELWIGPFERLNVGTGLMITKSIFSYCTAISSLT